MCVIYGRVAQLVQAIVNVTVVGSNLVRGNRLFLFTCSCWKRCCTESRHSIRKVSKIGQKVRSDCLDAAKYCTIPAVCRM